MYHKEVMQFEKTKKKKLKCRVSLPNTKGPKTLIEIFLEHGYFQLHLQNSLSKRKYQNSFQHYSSGYLEQCVKFMCIIIVLDMLVSLDISYCHFHHS